MKAASTFRTAADKGREITVTWNSEGIEFRQGKANRKQGWHAIAGWAESAETFVMLSKGAIPGKAGTFNPMPKRAFSTNELAEIKTHLAKAGVKKAKLFFY
jgi:hypothetical protein